MKNIMVDIETLGRAPGCVVLSIGACAFDHTEIGIEFETGISVKDSAKHGLTADPETAHWWMQQSSEALASIENIIIRPLDIALAEFSETFEWKDAKLWALGAAFDFPILEAAYSAVGLAVPWEYYQLNDLRTIRQLVGKNVYQANKVAPLIAHNAFDDAVAQARTLQNVLKAEGKSHWLKG